MRVHRLEIETNETYGTLTAQSASIQIRYSEKEINVSVMT
jgi:hypothetical protein